MLEDSTRPLVSWLSGKLSMLQSTEYSVVMVEISSANVQVRESVVSLGAVHHLDT